MERESERGKPTAAEEQEWTSRGCKRVCVCHRVSLLVRPFICENRCLPFPFASLMLLCCRFSRSSLLPLLLCSCATLASECLPAASTRDS